MRCLEGGEAVPGTTVKARPTVSTQALARAETAGSAGSDASHAFMSVSNDTFSAALADAAAETEATLPQSNTRGNSESCVVNSDHSNQQVPGLVSHTDSVANTAELADDSAVVLQGTSGTGAALPAAEVDKMEIEDTHATIAEASAEKVPVVAEEGSDPDCIGNPLYEEPDPVRPVPLAAAELALQPDLQPALASVTSAENPGSSGPSSCPDKGAGPVLPIILILYTVSLHVSVCVDVCMSLSCMLLSLAHMRTQHDALLLSTSCPNADDI